MPDGSNFKLRNLLFGIPLLPADAARQPCKSWTLYNWSFIRESLLVVALSRDAWFITHRPASTLGESQHMSDVVADLDW